MAIIQLITLHREGVIATMLKCFTFGESVSVDPRALQIVPLRQPMGREAVEHHHEVQLHAVHRDAVRADEPRDQRVRVV